MRAAGRTDLRVFGLAALFTIVAWAITIRGAVSMSSTMPMPGGWSMSMTWMSMGLSLPAHAAMFVAMWTTMMVAMMLPSVMPTVLLHRRLLASRAERGAPRHGSQVWLLVGYFSVWAAFGAVAYVAGMIAASAAMRSVSISTLIPAATGVGLIAAGGYQLTRWKRVCLQHCRSPLDFFTHHQIRGAGSSWAFGVHHGAYCAGCCWGLMLIQLVLGVMNVPLMMLVAAVIALEKQWRHGRAVATAAGAAAIAAGAWLLIRATIRA